jgi:hypothetical protein
MGSYLLTELDGGFIVANELRTNTQHLKYKYLVIVEAKHNVDFNRINNKMQQMYYIREYLKHAKAMKGEEIGEREKHSSSRYTQTFKDHVNMYQLDTITDVYLYFGGPTWEPNMVRYVKSLNDGDKNVLNDRRLLMQLNKEQEKGKGKDKKKQFTINEFAEVLEYMKGHIGSIVPKGTRYVVNDTDANVGGGRRKNCRQYSIPMINLPNYTNTQYT